MRIETVDLSDAGYGSVRVELGMSATGAVRGGTVFDAGEPIGCFGVSTRGLHVCGYGVPVAEGCTLVDSIREALHRYGAPHPASV